MEESIDAGREGHIGYRPGSKKDQNIKANEAKQDAKRIKQAQAQKAGQERVKKTGEYRKGKH